MANTHLLIKKKFRNQLYLNRQNAFSNLNGQQCKFVLYDDVPFKISVSKT